jgi:hypothetical protein
MNLERHAVDLVASLAPWLAPLPLDILRKVWYPVNAKTNGNGAFCFIATIHPIYGQSAFCKGTHVPPFVSATVANLTGGVLL